MNPRLLVSYLGSDKVLVYAQSEIGETKKVLPISYELFNTCYQKYLHGTSIPESFSMLNEEDQYFLATGR